MAEETQIYSRAPSVSFKLDQLAPPSNLYFGPTDSLQVLVTGSTAAVVNIRGRLLRADGLIIPFAEQVRSPTDRLMDSYVFPIGEGFLLSLQAAIAYGAGVQRGEVFIMLGLTPSVSGVQGEFHSMAQGYVSDTDRVTWPPGTQGSGTDGRGLIRFVVGSSPAAGAEIAESVPTGAMWRLISVRSYFATAVTVANRIVSWTVDDGTGVTAWISEPAVVQAASLTYSYECAAGVPHRIPTAAVNYVPMPPDMVLLAGHRIRTSTTNIQAGDQFTGARLMVEEWIQP